MKNKQRKKVYYCEECGQTYFRERKPIRCKQKGLLPGKCKSKTFKRILTEDDLK